MNNKKERVFLIIHSLLFLYLFYLMAIFKDSNNTYKISILSIWFSFSALSWLIRKLYPKLLKEDGSKPETTYYMIIGYLKYLSNDTANLFFFMIGFFFVRFFLIDISVVPTGSMQPNLLEGDVVLVSKTIFGLRAPWNNKKILISKNRKPTRGEMVCFIPPVTPFTNSDKTYLKRVIGLPGDTIKISRDKLEVIPEGMLDKYIDNKSDFSAKWTINTDEVSNTSILLTPQPIMIYEELLDLVYPIQFVKTYTEETKPTKTIVVPEGHYFLMGDNRNNSEDSRIFGCVPKENITSKPLIILYNYDTNGYIIPKIKFNRIFKKINVLSKKEKDKNINDSDKNN